MPRCWKISVHTHSYYVVVCVHLYELNKLMNLKWNWNSSNALQKLLNCDIKNQWNFVYFVDVPCVCERMGHVFAISLMEPLYFLMPFKRANWFLLMTFGDFFSIQSVTCRPQNCSSSIFTTTNQCYLKCDENKCIFIEKSGFFRRHLWSKYELIVNRLGQFGAIPLAHYLTRNSQKRR